MKHIFIPKGNKIITGKGCICKNQFRDNSGKKNKNQCTLDTNITPWCIVHDECGYYNSHGSNKGKWWDYCDIRENGSSNKIVYGKGYYAKNILGMIIYAILFIITIPKLLVKYKLISLLEVYLPNLDLIATSISFGNGPGKFKIFQELYNPSSQNILGNISIEIINILCLMGVSFLVIRYSFQKKSFLSGFCVAGVMLLTTYLLPNDIIRTLQDKFSDYMYKKTNVNPKYTTSSYIYYILVIILGVGVALLFILVERFIIDYHAILVEPIIKKIQTFGILEKMMNRFQ